MRDSWWDAKHIYWAISNKNKMRCTSRVNGTKCTSFGGFQTFRASVRLEISCYEPWGQFTQFKWQWFGQSMRIKWHSGHLSLSDVGWMPGPPGPIETICVTHDIKMNMEILRRHKQNMIFISNVKIAPCLLIYLIATTEQIDSLSFNCLILIKKLYYNIEKFIDCW